MIEWGQAGNYTDSVFHDLVISCDKSVKIETLLVSTHIEIHIKQKFTFFFCFTALLSEPEPQRSEMKEQKYFLK